MVPEIPLALFSLFDDATPIYLIYIYCFQNSENLNTRNQESSARNMV